MRSSAALLTSHTTTSQSRRRAACATWLPIDPAPWIFMRRTGVLSIGLDRVVPAEHSIALDPLDAPKELHDRAVGAGKLLDVHGAHELVEHDDPTGNELVVQV